MSSFLDPFDANGNGKADTYDYFVEYVMVDYLEKQREADKKKKNSSTHKKSVPVSINNDEAVHKEDYLKYARGLIEIPPDGAMKSAEEIYEIISSYAAQNAENLRTVAEGKKMLIEMEKRYPDNPVTVFMKGAFSTFQYTLNNPEEIIHACDKALAIEGISKEHIFYILYSEYWTLYVMMARARDYMSDGGYYTRYGNIPVIDREFSEICLKIAEHNISLIKNNDYINDNWYNYLFFESSTALITALKYLRLFLSEEEYPKYKEYYDRVLEEMRDKTKNESCYEKNKIFRNEDDFDEMVSEKENRWDIQPEPEPLFDINAKNIIMCILSIICIMGIMLKLTSP